MKERKEMDLIDVINFLHKNRKIISVILILISIMIGGLFVLNEVQNTRRETESFSSANLDRVDTGIYRLRVETFGDRNSAIREDTLVDFDRELSITIQEERSLLVLRIENLSEGLVVDNIQIIGRLNNRITDGRSFHFVDIGSHQMDLKYGEVSRGVPVPVFLTDSRGVREYQNIKFLKESDLWEFREFFEIDQVIVIGRVDNEEFELVYNARYDTYQFRRN